MRRLTLVPRVVAWEAYCTVKNGLSPVAALRRLPQAEPIAGRPPVVFVHGFLGHPENFRPLIRRMRLAGWRDLHAVFYPSVTTPLEGIVDAIRRTVDEVSEDTGPVDLVGHSLGAVACRAFLKRGGGAPQVRRFISLGGPHSGTSWWWVTPSHLRKVLRPDGRIVRHLNDGPEPVPTTVIRAQYDQQVFPPERASLAGVDEVVLSGLGHNGLLWSKEAHDAVLAALTSTQ